MPDSDGAGHREESTFADVLNSLTLDSGRGRRKRSRNRGADTAGSPDPAPVDDQVDPGTQTGEELPVSAEAIPLPAAEETGFVRPYAITGGRTKPSHTLELETLISTRDVTGVTPELLEHRAIIEECRTPRSVAEIAATLEVPIGVARVLISDAADAGLVTVHRTVTGSEGAEEHLILMERVLSGLRRL
nr:DUF742 domain-containing protein [Amycolatopsis arida]